MSERDQFRAVDAIQKAAGDAECEICKSKKWGIDARLYVPQMILFDGEKLFTPPGVVTAPMLMMTCQQCGNVKFLNTQVLNFFPEDSYVEGS